MRIVPKYLALAVAFVTAGQGAGAEMPTVFESFDADAADRWTYVADGVMGGVSEGRATFDAGAVRLTGTVSTANDGGFIQVRRRFEGGWPADARALRLEVRGNDQTYYVFLRTKGLERVYHSYRHAFEATSDWREVRLPFAEFAPSHDGMAPDFALTEVTGIGLVAYGRDHQADLQVRSIVLE